MMKQHENLNQCKEVTRQGSVMLETVIAIPLFMTLIGGMLWIGDLVFAKQRLVIADRYAAWNTGNRYRQVGGALIRQEIQDNFFSGDPDKTVEVDAPNAPPTRWWYEVYGGVDLDMTMPVWIQGWMAVGDDVLNPNGSSTAFQPPVITNHGRDIGPGPSGKYEGHVVLMRSGKDGTRMNDSPIDTTPGVDLTIDWTSITNEAWAGDSSQ